MITITSKGDFKKISSYLKRASKKDIKKILEKYAEEGLTALKKATPIDTGLTANSWSYEIKYNNKGGEITWINDNSNNGIPIVILLQYGHATANGTFVKGLDFINPAMEPVFKELSKKIWEEVSS